MFTIHIEHKLDAGILTITQVNTEIAPDETDGDPQLVEIFQFRFECDESGLWFDADILKNKLVAMCPILGEPDELFATLSEVPIVGINQQHVIIEFAAVGRKKSYPVIINLEKRIYAVDKQDVMELRAENVVLRRKLDGQDKHIAKLEKMCEEFRMNFAYLAADTYRRTCTNVYSFPDSTMSDDLWINLMSPICKPQQCIDPTCLFDAPYWAIMRAIDHGIDPNQIIGNATSSNPGMPLIFLIVRNVQFARIGDNVKKIDDARILIRNMFLHGQNANVKYNNISILAQFTEYDKAYSAKYSDNSLIIPFQLRIEIGRICDIDSIVRDHGLNKEYLEYRNEILKRLRDAGAE